MSDLQSSTLSTDEIASTGPATSSEKLRDDWVAIRDHLEQIAASSSVDGRTKAKYARIDRRRYLDLINALAADNSLGNEAPSYREAATIWQKYRNGRRSPSADDSARISNLRNLLAGEPK